VRGSNFNHASLAIGHYSVSSPGSPVIRSNAESELVTLTEETENGFIAGADEKLTVFLELEAAIRAVAAIVLDEQPRFCQNSWLTRA
jgi:hypothetical protein